jgi:hypothetical protein
LDPIIFTSVEGLSPAEDKYIDCKATRNYTKEEKEQHSNYEKLLVPNEDSNGVSVGGIDAWIEWSQESTTDERRKSADDGRRWRNPHYPGDPTDDRRK